MELINIKSIKNKILSNTREIRNIPHRKNIVYFTEDYEKCISIKKEYKNKELYYCIFINMNLYTMANNTQSIADELEFIDKNYNISYKINEYITKEQIAEQMIHNYKSKIRMKGLEY